MTRMRPLSACRYAGLLLAAIGTAAPACASCSKVTFGNFSSTVYAGSGAGGSYDVFDDSVIGQSITFSVTKSTGGFCSYKVGATDGIGNSFSPRKLFSAGSTLNYNLYTSSALTNVLQDIPTTNSNLIRGSLNGKGTNSHTYFFFIPAQQIVKPGVYADVVTFTLYGDNDEVDDTQIVSHGARVFSQAELSIVPAGAAFSRETTAQNINFGNLSVGQTFAVDVLGRGNNGFDLTMQSLNGQVLKIDDPRDNSTIPYTISVNGAVADLTDKVARTVVSVPGATLLAGNRFPVVIRIQNFDAAAGTYRDSITVSVIAK